MQCIGCGRELNVIDIGLHKKLVNRGATEYLCKACLAEKFEVTVELLDQKVKEFREYGCLLFPKEEE